MAKIDKLVEQAKPHLEPGETVLTAVMGAYETKIMGADSTRNGVFVATDRRVLFYAKKMGGYDLESFPYSSISSFEQSKSLMGHSISFFASGNKVSMKWINAGDVGDFTSQVRTRIGGGTVAVEYSSVPPTMSTPSDASDDVFDKLRKLTELHQSGVLTDSEYESKKAQLLKAI